MIDPLYQKEILRLAGEARGAGRLAGATITLTVKNPLCGDQIRLDVLFNDKKVADLAHETRACVLCQASASLIATLAPGQSEANIRQARDMVAAMLAGDTHELSGWKEYAVFTPVIDHPGRHKCVTLPLDALVKAFDRLRAR